jgi:hypothetical protein
MATERQGEERGTNGVAARPARRRVARAPAVTVTGTGIGTHSVLPPEWREFVGNWLASTGSTVRDAARGDWEVELAPGLQKRWRRQRVRLVFDPLRATLPRGAWFTAPGSTAGRRILDAALAEPQVTRRTALLHVPGVDGNGLAEVVRVRGLKWGPPRLGPVRYERRVSFHAVATRWGGLPWQEPWVVLLGPAGEVLEWVRDFAFPDLRSRDGLYQMSAELELEQREAWVREARSQIERLLRERESEWERAVSRLCDDELERLGAFFSARIEEEEERLRRRTGSGEDAEMDVGDGVSLKLEWERRAAEVRSRWALRTEVRLWGLTEWSWPVADLEQELRSGAVHVRLTSKVDVARGRPALPGCPSCGSPAEMLVRVRGSVGCVRCA